MEKAKRARKAETLKQPSLSLRLRAPYLYPDRADSALADPCSATEIGAGVSGAGAAAEAGAAVRKKGKRRRRGAVKGGRG